MKYILLLTIVPFFLQNCIAQPSARKEAYAWIGFETVPRDSMGKVNAVPFWDTPHKIDMPIDTFVIYRNNDSIRMVTIDAPQGKLFRKVHINATRWKPRQNYDNKLFFLGTYLREGLDGLYISFYATRDWSTLMQVYYTNPGNLDAVLIFSKNPVNILQRAGIIIDPKDELSEPETGQMKSK